MVIADGDGCERRLCVLELPLPLLCERQQLASFWRCPYAMASSHSSPPVPHVSSSDGFFKKETDSTKCLRSVRSLPDVCPKEPTGTRKREANSLCDGPSVVADQHRWTVYHSKVNLPAALNDPRLAKRESDFFTKTWGLDFMETEVMPSFYLPPITKEHFAPYFHETTQREKIHERCKNICPPKNDFDSTLSAASHPYDKSKTDLEQVPKIFMKPDFALEDPLIFNAVLPWSHFSGAGGKGSRDVASSRLLQEKLSHYLDVVEVNIAHQISLRSEAFFHAMTSQHELQDYLRKTSQAVKMLRDKISQIDKVMCEGSLQILRLALTRNNCVKVYNKLKLMATVHQTQPTVQLLLSTSEFVGALDLIATTQEVLQQELQGIHSFRHLGSQLCELEKLIDKMMIADFSTYARSDLNRPLEEDYQVLEEERLISLVFGLLKQRKLNFLDIYSDEMIAAAKNIVKQCVINIVSQMEEIDTEVVVKLGDQMRIMNFPQWFELLNDIFSKFTIFLKRIKATLNVVRSVVLLVLDKYQKTRELESASVHNSCGKGLGIDPEVAYLIHEGMFISDSFSNGEQASAGTESRFIRTTDPNSELCGSDSVSEPECTTDSSSSKEQTSSSVTPGGVEITINEDMKLTDLELGRVANGIQELLYNASDICHDRCVKFIMARAKDGFLEKLNSSEFVSLSRSVETFAQETERICCRKSMSLRGALQSQANRFVHRFHEERKTKLSLLLDNERWKQAEVPAEFQDLVDSISDGKITLPDKKASASEDKKPTDFLIVEGQKYAVVGTVLLLIRIILEYCQCVDDIPSITTDMLTRLSDLLKHFNSRSCQLVLGAGALQVVGLKTITTKNLALASRCLQLIVHYIPIIRAHFEARIQPKQYSMLRHFDHITKDYNDHIAEILAKLVAIMDNLFDKLLSKYEVKAPVPSNCFRNVCKQSAKMHEAISDLLPEEQTQMLFLRINANFKLHLKRQLTHLNVINDGGPQHGLVTADVAFYTGNIQVLKGLEDLDLNMAEIWEQKR
ncbi:vacuolar protein sorting-associated protein 54 isoform X2 [Latimeria chalumnae]|uniref:vacuolar protein sorting-associated protein 54 isoform X2 n=1 Tax=Latimeria chalumnae TaxID=7897 RepID=UPI0003C13492|nr:PREDICTED: vacuolar protein sorting-associated protein 54 isoform X2 [Latimeria chalumnae]|eukprot:XP_005989608.1 PREDICTED: vacuolar protein sorting-associated protein 54 isoform X2 [Latimeria chalumnae]